MFTLLIPYCYFLGMYDELQEPSCSEWHVFFIPQTLPSKKLAVTDDYSHRFHVVFSPLPTHMDPYIVLYCFDLFYMLSLHCFYMIVGGFICVFEMFDIF